MNAICLYVCVAPLSLYCVYTVEQRARRQFVSSKDHCCFILLLSPWCCLLCWVTATTPYPLMWLLHSFWLSKEMEPLRKHFSWLRATSLSVKTGKAGSKRSTGTAFGGSNHMWVRLTDSVFVESVKILVFHNYLPFRWELGVSVLTWFDIAFCALLLCFPTAKRMWPHAHWFKGTSKLVILQPGTAQSCR